jgi:hypothetical protein
MRGQAEPFRSSLLDMRLRRCIFLDRGVASQDFNFEITERQSLSAYQTA